MRKCKLAITPRLDSQIVLLRRKLKGLPERKTFVFVVDKERDSRRVKEYPQINEFKTRMQKTVEVVCVSCGDKFLAYKKTRKYCDDPQCRSKAAQKASHAARIKAGK